MMTMLRACNGLTTKHYTKCDTSLYTDVYSISLLSAELYQGKGLLKPSICIKSSVEFLVHKSYICLEDEKMSTVVHITQKMS